MVTERAVEMQKDVYMCLVDFEKAFETIRQEEMIDVLKEIGLDGKDVRMINNLYWELKAAIRIKNKNTEWVEIQRGVWQGCVLSPDTEWVEIQRGVW